MLPINFVEVELEKDIPMFYWLNLVVNIIFVIDILINFFTVYHDENNVVIDEFNGIALK